MTTKEMREFLARPLDAPFSVRAVNALGQAGAAAALTIGEAREHLIAFAGNDSREVWAELQKRIKQCGPAVATELCEALGFPIPAPKKHCATCTCAGHK